MPPSRTSCSTASPILVVLGVDPGTRVTGYGILTLRGSSLSLEDAGAIRTRPGASAPEKLRYLYEELSSVIERHQPSEFAIESAFYGKNAQSALTLGQARGVLMLAAAEQAIPVAEYSPREVKKAITGNGNAGKEQVLFMVRSLLRLAERPMTHDTSDAIAIGLCHVHRMQSGGRKTKEGWGSFIAAHPERVAR